MLILGLNLNNKMQTVSEHRNQNYASCFSIYMMLLHRISEKMLALSLNNLTKSIFIFSVLG